MSLLTARNWALKAALTLVVFAGIASSLGCEPILTPAGHKQPNPATPRVAGGVNGAEQSTLFIYAGIPPFVATVKWSISNDFDGWLSQGDYTQTYVGNWLGVHNWNVLPDILKNNFGAGFSTSVTHYNYFQPQDFLLTSNSNGDGADCRAYTIQLPYWITCSDTNYIWHDPFYRTRGSVGWENALFATSETEIGWLPE